METPFVRKLKTTAAVLVLLLISVLIIRLCPSKGMMSKKTPPKPSTRMPCSELEACFFTSELKRIAQQEMSRARMDDSAGARQAAWLMAKANYALTKCALKPPAQKQTDAQLFFLEDTYYTLIRACHQSRQGVTDIQEEKGSRLRAYISEIDGTFQTYSISVPSQYDPTLPWPLIVSMHGHGWYAPYQGHPAPAYAGAFCLSPQGRGATDYKDIGECDVMRAIAEVKHDFNIDPDRVYLTGASMGGTGAFNLAVKFADQFAGILPICGNADNEAWTLRWKWNRKFPGRYDKLRKWIQESHTARAYAENLLNMPTFIIAGSGDSVVPPEHSRNMVDVLRKYSTNLQYREFPGAGHGGFPQNSVADALAWTCSWKRNPYPKYVFWKADAVKYGAAYWLRMEQFARPLATAIFSADARNPARLEIHTKNLLAFSFMLPRPLFPAQPAIVVDGQSVKLDAQLPVPADGWFTLRRDPIHGWLDQRLLPLPRLMKKANLEGPVSDALTAPFMLVVGSASLNPEINAAWLREAQTFASEWKRRNGEKCLMVMDTMCTLEDMQKRNLILFGGRTDNAISALVAKSIPMADIMSKLPIRNEDPMGLGNALEAPDLGSIVLYPNVEYARERLVVMLSANAPEGIFQLWGRFGNWFNWGVYDSYKYFDYAVFDSRSVSPETMQLLGWYGTDWSVSGGECRPGVPELRDAVVPQGYPPFAEAPADVERLLLAELMPAKIDQMRGAVGFGRGFFGEELEAPGSLGMRAPCTLEYDNARFGWLTAAVVLRNSPETGMCMPREKGEAVRFTVYGDGRMLQSRTVTWKKPLAHIAVCLKDVSKLKLEAVPSSGPSWLHSGAAWLEPTLWRSLPPQEILSLAESDEPPK